MLSGIRGIRRQRSGLQKSPQCEELTVVLRTRSTKTTNPGKQTKFAGIALCQINRSRLIFCYVVGTYRRGS